MGWVAGMMLAVALAAASMPAGAQPAPPPEVVQAQQLTREGRAEEAWRLLSPLEPQHAGQPDFDLALAMAATDSGRPNLATFALERLVITQPANATARLELARAYYALRDYERAERELQFILRGDPPADVRALVAQYRARMDELPANVAAPRAGWSGYAEAGLGHDTNANAASAQGSVFVPSLGGDLVLAPGSVRAHDRFAELAAGALFVQPWGARWTLLAGADLRLRGYAGLDAFDSQALDLRGGLRQRLAGGDHLEYTLGHADLDLDRADYRRTQSAGAQWSRRLGERARLGVFAQGYRIRYRRADVRDASSDMLVAGASGAYALRWAVVLGGVLAGTDAAAAGRIDGDRRVFGANAGLQRRFAGQVNGHAGLALVHSSYRQDNAQFGLARRDRQLDLSLGLSWEVADGWELRPQLVRTRNRSNIAVNDYARTEASLALRRTWD